MSLHGAIGVTVSPGSDAQLGPKVSIHTGNWRMGEGRTGSGRGTGGGGGGRERTGHTALVIPFVVM